MGIGVSRLNTLAWSLVDRMLHLLDAEEREGVRGDLAESDDSASQALWSVLCLAVYRQSVLWRGSRPWLVLILFVLPLGVLLSVTSSELAGTSAIYLWLEVNNLDLSLVRSPGYWYTLLQVLPPLLLPCLVFGCVAWMAGVLLTGISRGRLGINGTLLCVAVLCGNAFALSRLTYNRTFDCNAAVHANAFYRIVFPILFKSLCVLLPAFMGMRQGLRSFSASVRSLLFAFVVICSLSMLASVTTCWWLQIWSLSPLALAAFAFVGPAGYLLVERHSFRRRYWA
jgi:hypothetical protein